MPFIEDNLIIIILTILAIQLILIISFIAMTVRYKALRKSYRAMLNNTNTPNLEQVLSDVHESIQQLNDGQDDQQQQIHIIQDRMKLMNANVGIHRYSAYDQNGSDMSFSIAVVDEYSSGIVLTSLHSREQTMIYAKQLDKGESKYALSTEEKTAINQAVNKAKP